MTMDTVRRLAAQIKKVGRNRIRILDQKKAKEAATHEDVKKLISDGVIKVAPVKGRHKKEKPKKKRKARRGPGKKKGTPKARLHPKEAWIKRIRALRKFLNELVGKGSVDKALKRTLYLKIKGGHFKGKRMFLNYLKDMNLLNEKAEAEKRTEKVEEETERAKAGTATAKVKKAEEAKQDKSKKSTDKDEAKK